jgi:hypothetical protein
MSDRLTRRFVNLSQDTRTVIMPPGSAIRRRGEQRSRRTAIAVGAAVFAVIVGAGVGAAAVFDRRDAAPPFPGNTSAPAPTAPPSSAAPSPSTSSTTAGRVVTTIPASAMLQRADFKQVGGGEPLDYGSRTYWDPGTLRPCGGPFPSDALKTASRGVAGTATFARTAGSVDRTPTAAEERVNAYQPGGATQFMMELRDQLARCPGTLGENRSRWTVVGFDLGGDESLLIEQKWLGQYPQAPGLSEVGYYIGVVRTGNLVAIVVSTGWETPSGSPEVVREFMPLALQRLASLH